MIYDSNITLSFSRVMKKKQLRPGNPQTSHLRTTPGQRGTYTYSSYYVVGHELGMTI